MALAKTTLTPTVAENVGQFAPFAFGIDATAGTSFTVTVPQFAQCYGALGLSTSTTTATYTGTTSTNTFSMTKGSGETVMWVAFGKLKV